MSLLILSFVLDLPIDDRMTNVYICTCARIHNIHISKVKYAGHWPHLVAIVKYKTFCNALSIQEVFGHFYISIL